MSITDLLRQALDFLPVVLAIMGVSAAIGIGLTFGSRIVNQVREALEADMRVTGNEDWLIGEKPKNEGKRKNDESDPFAETEAPYMTIGDDGELVEVEGE